MAAVTTEEKDALKENGELLVPMLIINIELGNEKAFAGIIPGVLMKNIISRSKEECAQKLKQYLVDKLKLMLQKNEPFPAFPTKAEIEKEYDDIESLSFIKIKSSKK